MAGQRINLPPYSMFLETPVYEVNGDIAFGLMRDAVVPDPSDIVYVVQPAAQYRMDLISSKFYGTPELWWVIALVNRIEDPLTGPAPGTTIRIPTSARLASRGVLTT